MHKRYSLALAANMMLTLASGGVAVTGAQTQRVARRTTTAQGQTRPAPDNSTIVIEERDGTHTETRTFGNKSSRITRVVRTTTPDGKRRTRVYYADGSVRELREGDDENVLEQSADALASFATSAVDVTADVARETAEVTTNVAGATVETAKDAASATAETTRAVASATVETTGKVASTTAEKASDVASATAQGTRTAVEAGKEVAEKTGDAAGATVETAREVGSTTAKATSTVVDKTGDAVGQAVSTLR